jgi:FkbM family methyltransferase
MALAASKKPIEKFPWTKSHRKVPNNSIDEADMYRISGRICVLLLILLLLSSALVIAEAKLISEDRQSSLELWETALGRLWIPKPGSAVIKHLEWEQSVEKVYDHRSVHVMTGDIVLDCGAHIGGFTRTALLSGARLVVAIEPEKSNLVAFKRNFSEALKNGKVILVEKGVWDKAATLPLHLSTVGDSHSVAIAQNTGKDQIIELATIDHIVESLKLPRVDFIKFDIEGAELNALVGARQVLKQWRPRLAVSSYHKKGDPSAICSEIWNIQPCYLVESKDLLRGLNGSEVPKVLFFR